MNSITENMQRVSFHFRLNHLPLLFILLISVTICPLAAHGCHEQERRALLSFKSSLEDPSHRLSSWQEGNQHRNCCNWRGIRCSDTALHVVSIDLRNIELENYVNEYNILHKNRYVEDIFNPPSTSLIRGKLSPSLINITYLEFLDLAFNDFHPQEPEIPFRFSKLTKLTHLDLSNTNFSASIATSFTNLPSLQYLDLTCTNSFYTVSCFESPSAKWTRGLVNLQVLRLSGIDLSEATASKANFSQHISHLWDLRDLDISSCSISSTVFPINQFHNLSRLSSLKMNDNEISSSIPSQLVNLTSLSILELTGCQLHGSIPYLPQLKELDVTRNFDLNPSLTRMFQHPWPRLRKLHISSTDATGSIPSSISNAPLLVSLSAYMCSISELPSSISNLKYLSFLELSNNNIQGPIPDSICDIPPLRHLDLSFNNISGTIPSCITKLHNLSFFNVYGNSIRGEVSLNSLINELDLTYLDMSSNKLTIIINQHLQPSKFKLEYLDLESCNVEGYIPNFICNFTHLERIDFSNNKLTRAIPSCISNLKNINYLDLSHNELTGAIPSYISNLKDLNYLDLSHNKITGAIPSRISNLKKLINLDFSRNRLHGPVPLLPSGVNYFDLNTNELSGIISPNFCLGDCKSLYYLNLGKNDFSGSVPNDLNRAENLNYLQLNDNNLNGTFPVFVQELLSLIVLNLGNNNFKGNIPTGLGSLSDLKILSLRSNKFNGSIPEEIIHLERLQILDLSLNNFSGPIPINLGNLTSMTGRVSLDEDGLGVQYELAIKGTTIQFEQFLLYNSGIDLSCNTLNGSIPDEIGLLHGLGMLNLSHNIFSGNIPASVGNMSRLESLDLSSNRLSGRIPHSLASIDALGYLSLSHNNLSGRIPTGNHFDTLSVNGTAFAGNALLCGFPMEKVCDSDKHIDTSDTSPSMKVDEDDQEDAKEKFLLYAIVAMGVAVGFWGLFLVLLLRKQKWWFPYWRMVNFVAIKLVEGCIHKD